MVGYSRDQIALALMLAGLAGFVDGMGFIHLGGLFVSFMSGNSTRLGVSLAQGEWLDAATGGGIIFLFVIGAACGALLTHGEKSTGRRAILIAESLLLAIAALSHIVHLPMVSIGAMVIAMGIENAFFQRNGEPGIGLTYMTGALVRVGHRLAFVLRGGNGEGWFPSLLLWLSLCTGALLGALAYGAWSLTALWIPSGVAAALTLLVRSDAK